MFGLDPVPDQEPLAFLDGPLNIPCWSKFEFVFMSRAWTERLFEWSLRRAEQAIRRYV